MKKRVLLKDVAAHLGVSIALVSYIVNGREEEEKVSPGMVKKVRAAIERLGYQPNLVAKSLKSGRTNTIGLLVADISNPFFSNIARIIEDEAKKYGYVVIFGSSDENADLSRELIDVFLSHQVDAFIIAPAASTESDVKALQKRNIPVVLIDRYFPNVTADSVTINNYQASRQAVLRLVKNKRSKIAMMVYRTDLAHMQDRKKGYKSALKEKGIRFKSGWLSEIDYQHMDKDMNAALRDLLCPLKIDALVFATNSLAAAGLKKIQEWGIRVPEQLAIISFDESDAFDFFYSPISYVSQSLENIGRRAVQLAVARIADPAKKQSYIVIKAKLVLRKSCGS